MNKDVDRIALMAKDKKKINAAELWKRSCEFYNTWATSTSFHGVARIAESTANIRRVTWTVIVIIAISGCLYHIAFMITKYLSYSKNTITEEVHAVELEFPALTVCNFNILKKTFLRDQLRLKRQEQGFCFTSVEDFLSHSDAKDISDIWAKLGITSALLMQYGHKVYDLIVQCTYNNEDCFEESITSALPQQTEHMTISNFTSTRLGLCHTILLNKTTLGKVRKAGQTRGLTLTLNIERDQYLNLLTPEYGVRLMVHPRHSYPTVERGAIALHPGTKSYVGVKIREIKRLPEPYGDCTDTFLDSPISGLLKSLDENFTFGNEIYTYEYCQALCRETLLMVNCSCVDEHINAGHIFCNPCNATQEKCRTEFAANYTAMDNGICTTLCKPACNDLRYDLSLSTSEWPNMEYQLNVLRRWPELIPDFIPKASRNSTVRGIHQLNETYINKNFLRVHVFMEEMNFMRFEDSVAYTLPEMFADLGGCLGLYIGVSVISICEALELFSNVMTLLCSTITVKVAARARQKSAEGEAIARRRALRFPSMDINAVSVDKRPRSGSRKMSRGAFPRFARRGTNVDGLNNFCNGVNEKSKRDILFQRNSCTKGLTEIQIHYRSQIFQNRHPRTTTFEDECRRNSTQLHEDV